MLFHFFPFLKCFKKVSVHVKDLESKRGQVCTNRSSSLPQKTLLLKCLISLVDFNAVTL